MRISVRLEWDMGHRLPHHNGQCANLHGHRYVAEFMVDGPVNVNPGTSDEGMVVDFALVKDVAKSEIVKLDHKFLLQDVDPVLIHLGRTVALGVGVIVVPYVPTAENIAADLLQRCNEKAVMRLHTYKFSAIRLYETPTSWVEATL